MQSSSYMMSTTGRFEGRRLEVLSRIHRLCIELAQAEQGAEGQNEALSPSLAAGGDRAAGVGTNQNTRGLSKDV
jgi:hypothetical protein